MIRLYRLSVATGPESRAFVPSLSSSVRRAFPDFRRPLARWVVLDDVIETNDRILIRLMCPQPSNGETWRCLTWTSADVRSFEGCQGNRSG